MARHTWQILTAAALVTLGAACAPSPRAAPPPLDPSTPTLLAPRSVTPPTPSPTPAPVSTATAPRPPTATTPLPSPAAPSSSPPATAPAAPSPLPTEIIPAATATREQILRHDGALLYVDIRTPTLMVADALGDHPVAISDTSCLPEQTTNIAGAWSADGRFIAFACKGTDFWADGYVYDTRTDRAELVGSGHAIAFAWSPTGSRLLVHLEGPPVQTFLLDPSAGRRRILPVTASWRPHGAYGSSQGYGDGTWYPSDAEALMSWSPDGGQIAINGSYVLDAASLAVRAEYAVSAFTRPAWSRDGQQLIFVHQQPNAPTAEPNSSPSRQAYIATEMIALDLQTGTTTVLDSYPHEFWSPDGSLFVRLGETSTGTSVTLYRADGTPVSTVVRTSEGFIYGATWTRDSAEVIVQVPEGFPSQRTQILAFDRGGRPRTILGLDAAVTSGFPLLPAVSPDNRLLAVPMSGVVRIYGLDGALKAIFDAADFSGWRPSQV